MKKIEKLGYKRKKNLKITDSNKDLIQEKFMEEYRKDGVSMNKACKRIGFTRFHVYKWAETDPEFAEEFEKLKFMKKNKTEKEFKERHKNDEKHKEQFLEYYSDENNSVVDALDKISELFDEEVTKNSLDYWKRTDNNFHMKYKKLQQKLRPRLSRGVETRKMMSSEKTANRQDLFLEVFRDKGFQIGPTCKALGINRAVITDWCKKNPDFKAAVEAIKVEKLDFVEDALFDMVNDRNPAAVIFAAKCLLQEASEFRNSGFVEQPQKIEGHITHTHELDQDQLDAIVRGQQVDRNKYRKLLEKNEDIVDAEYTEEDDE